MDGIEEHTTSSEWIEYYEWVSTGITRGWISDVSCETHDPIMTEEDIVAWEEGDDICRPMFRAWMLQFGEPRHE